MPAADKMGGFGLYVLLEFHPKPSFILYLRLTKKNTARINRIIRI